MILDDAYLFVVYECSIDFRYTQYIYIYIYIYIYRYHNSYSYYNMVITVLYELNV